MSNSRTRTAEVAVLPDILKLVKVVDGTRVATGTRPDPQFFVEAVRRASDPRVSAYYVAVDDDPSKPSDCLVLHTETRLPWSEVVLLFFRPLLVRASTPVQNEIGRTWDSDVSIWAARWRWPWQSRGGMAVLSKSTDEEPPF